MNSLTYKYETTPMMELFAIQYPEMLKNLADAVGVSIVNAIIGMAPADKKNAHKKKQMMIKSLFKKARQVLNFPTLKDGKIDWTETKKVEM